MANNVINLEKLHTGDENAWRLLFLRHYPVMCYYASRFFDDSFLAKAIASDVIAHLWEIRRDIQINASLRSYLLHATGNKCIDYLKSVRMTGADSIPVLPEDNANPLFPTRADLKDSFKNITVEAPARSKSTMTLPDGTLICLNACSSLKYSQGFGIKDRDVELIGECYFEVYRNEALPFNVKSENIKVQVLGTKFNFRDYPDEMEATVSLIEGRVALQNLTRPKEKLKYLSQDKQVVLDKRTNELRIDSKDASKAISWESGILFFDEVMLFDIARELERAYNVSISIQNEKLSQMRIYGNFLSREQKIEDILNLLTATNNLSYSINGRDVQIFNR